MKRTIVFGLVSLLVTRAIYAEKSDIRHYQAPLGEEQWQVKASRLQCGLSLKIVDYGIAYFEQQATKEPRFYLSAWQQEPSLGTAEIWNYPPTWRPALRPKLVSRLAMQQGKPVLALTTGPTLEVLSGLAVGYKTRISYQTGVGRTVWVDLSPIHFKKQYGHYVQCVGDLLPFNYDDVKHTIIYFSSFDYELTLEDRNQLERVALYAMVDKSVKRIAIAGYTDNTGRRGVNQAVSERRAKVVANYLLSQGLPSNKIDVTWYGMLYPTDTNDTEIGRAKNRRVVIRVIK